MLGRRRGTPNTRSNAEPLACIGDLDSHYFTPSEGIRQDLTPSIIVFLLVDG
jgi:hypothetical protein